MSDDPLEALGRVARERDAERERWGEEPGRDRALLEPPSADERARVLAKVLPRVSERGAAVPERRPLFPSWASALAGVAAAAALVVVSVMWGRATAPVLPEYALEVPSLGYSGVRGEAPARPVLAVVPAMALEVVLRPDGAWSEPLAARVFVEHQGQRRELSWPAHIAPTGACRWTGEVGREVELPVGRSRLGFVVGVPARVQGAELAQVDERSPGLRVRWLEIDVGR